MDEGQRALERAAAAGDPDAGRKLLVSRVRAGEEITEESLLQHLPDLSFRQTLLPYIQDRPDAFSRFLERLPQQIQAARELHDRYPWLRGDEVPEEHRDVSRPTPERALSTLSAHLETHPLHRDAIRNMQEPTVQLEPIFKPGEESAGFRRITNAMDARQGAPRRTEIWEQLQNRWNIPDEVPQGQGQVIGWNVVVTEGKKNLPRENNPWAGQRLDRQLQQWLERDGVHGLHLPNRVRSIISNMGELLRDGRSGIDTDGWALLEDPTQTTGSLVANASWDGGRVRFNGNRPGNRNRPSRLRSSVVVRCI